MLHAHTNENNSYTDRQCTYITFTTQKYRNLDEENEIKRDKETRHTRKSM